MFECGRGGRRRDFFQRPPGAKDRIEQLGKIALDLDPPGRIGVAEVHIGLQHQPPKRGAVAKHARGRRPAPGYRLGHGRPIAPSRWADRPSPGAFAARATAPRPKSGCRSCQAARTSARHAPRPPQRRTTADRPRAACRTACPIPTNPWRLRKTWPHPFPSWPGNLPDFPPAKRDHPLCL